MSNSELKDTMSPAEASEGTDVPRPLSDDAGSSKVVEPAAEQKPGNDPSTFTGNRFAPRTAVVEPAAGRSDQPGMSPQQRVGDLLNVRPTGRGSKYVRGEWLGAMNRTLHDVYPPEKARGLMKAIERDDFLRRVPFVTLHEMNKDPYWKEQITLWNGERSVLDSFRNLGKVIK